jgi:hypothetical protein
MVIRRPSNRMNPPLVSLRGILPSVCLQHPASSASYCCVQSRARQNHRCRALGPVAVFVFGKDFDLYVQV